MLNLDIGCIVVKFVYGRLNDASKIKYLDWLYRLDYDKIPYEDFQSLLGTSVELANNLYDEQVSEILLLEEQSIIKKLRK